MSDKDKCYRCGGPAVRVRPIKTGWKVPTGWPAPLVVSAHPSAEHLEMAYLDLPVCRSCDDRITVQIQ